MSAAHPAEWRPRAPVNQDQFKSAGPGANGTHEEKEAYLESIGMGLSPEDKVYHDAETAGAELRDRMKGMSVKERHEHMRGLREGLQERDAPKRGDLDNPLVKDMPKEPNPPREPRQPRPPSPMATVKRAQSLARMARGRRR